MKTVSWTPEMALGILAMDESHKALLDGLERLAATPDTLFAAGFTALTAAVERDFAEEEAAMESIGFPGLRAHREQHARVLSGLHHTDPFVRQGDVAQGRRAIELLPQWFVMHQSSMDLALAAALDLATQSAPLSEVLPGAAAPDAPVHQHILVPSDGSPASETAIRTALRFAKQIGARVTGLHVVPEFRLFTYQSEMLEDTREQFAKDSHRHAQQVLASIESTAKELGVPCDTVQVVSDHPYEAIADTARELRCDLIAMASHGRCGIKGLLLGSETQKVLMHSTIPVLVYR
ncbi:universal stress protein [Janthinobacterium sp.]|uniref:universal stress protein n=1 Tax=Janthinobacterium sp. TaxID=1871054 RepID=UPI00293D71F9|nr:universal stress protein [Janthinobacterium sp.]